MFIHAIAFFLFLTLGVFAQQPTPILPDPNLTPAARSMSYWSFHNLGDVAAFKKRANQGRAFRHSF